MHDVRLQAIYRAADVIDDERELCRMLRVQRGQLEEWLLGRGDPPPEIVLRAEEIVEDDWHMAQGYIRCTPSPE